MNDEKPYLRKLKELRKKRGLSQVAISEALGLNPSSYGKIENGETLLDVDRAYKIAEILNVSISDIILPEKEYEFTEPGKLETSEPDEARNYIIRNANIVFQIGDGKNSPEADKFLKRLGELLRDSDQGLLFLSDSDD